jgi:hypothetical protein
MNPISTRKETDLETEIKTTNSNTFQKTKPKITYDDILKSLNLKVNNGILEYSLTAPAVAITNQNQYQYQNQNQNQNCSNSLKTCYRKQQNQQQNPIPIPIQEKSSYIYNKYFKDYKDKTQSEATETFPKIYLTREEFKKRLILEQIRKREERKKIEEVKSKKLLFARNNHFAPTNAIPNKLNQLFLLRR